MTNDFRVQKKMYLLYSVYKKRMDKLIRKTNAIRFFYILLKFINYRQNLVMKTVIQIKYKGALFQFPLNEK